MKYKALQEKADRLGDDPENTQAMCKKIAVKVAEDFVEHMKWDEDLARVGDPSSSSHDTANSGVRLELKDHPGQASFGIIVNAKKDGFQVRAANSSVQAGSDGEIPRGDLQKMYKEIEDYVEEQLFE